MTINNRKYKQPKYEEVLETKDDGQFQIGQTYDDKANKTLICKKCGSDKFHVGQGDCYTTIKCPKCKWELGIHDG